MLVGLHNNDRSLTLDQKEDIKFQIKNQLKEKDQSNKNLELSITKRKVKNSKKKLISARDIAAIENLRNYKISQTQYKSLTNILLDKMNRVNNKFENLEITRTKR